MHSGGLVSVILPTFDRAELLPRSIGSVLAQTDGHLELIVVDDGSSDDTEGVVARLADPRVRYLRLPENRGLPAARNAGIAIARGEYVAFQDSDDVWAPDKLARVVVQPGRRRDHRVELRSGLEPGALYVASGALLLLNQVELAD